MESYTNAEKGDIFESVNSLYLHLSKRKKSETKRCFKTQWKEDNLLYTMMMALHGSYDKWEKLNENEDLAEELSYVQNQGNMTIKKHKRFMAMVSEENEELEKRLQDVTDGKGYISEEYHNEEMKEQLEEQKEIIREISSKLSSSKNKASAYETKYEMKCKDMEAQKKYYEHQISKVIDTE
tara:strand:- start:613 stop:1155 length:543 start_codon:yes stop_codon:yes gene_type:complete